MTNHELLEIIRREVEQAQRPLREQSADVAEQLIEEMTRLQMRQGVLQSAFVALARHLSLLGHLDLETLIHDLDLLGQSHPDEAWQSGHGELSGALKLVLDMLESRPK